MNIMIIIIKRSYLQSESVSSRKLLSISRKSRLISVLDKQCTPIVIIVIINCSIRGSSINDGRSGNGDGDGSSIIGSIMVLFTM